jgi:hypothetical protein
MAWKWDLGINPVEGEMLVCFPSTCLKEPSTAVLKSVYTRYPAADYYKSGAKAKLGETSKSDKVVNFFIRKYPVDIQPSDTDVGHFKKCLDKWDEPVTLLFNLPDLTDGMLELLETKYAGRRRKTKLDISKSTPGIVLFEIDFKQI